MRALWIDAGLEHALRMRGRVEMRTLYFRPDRAPTMLSPCCVIEGSRACPQTSFDLTAEWN